LLSLIERKIVAFLQSTSPGTDYLVMATRIGDRRLQFTRRINLEEVNRARCI
jgi:hypothetical protein